MARLSKNRNLNIWMNGELVGNWLLTASNESMFKYDDQWIKSPLFRPLSLSLPIGFKTEQNSLKNGVVNSYFDNLLPDSIPIRKRLQSRFKTNSADAFDLLEEIGRDCVGAIQILSSNKEPPNIKSIDVKPLSEHEIEKWLINATTPTNQLNIGNNDEDNFRISIAGAQEKTAFTFHNGRWCKPIGSTPTAHIFKLPMGLVGSMQADMSTSVENEWLYSQIMKEFNLPVSNCEIGVFGSKKVLMIERFDRKLSSDKSHWLRLPQEDFCQAAGYPSSKKYECEGGPGLEIISDILKNSVNSQNDMSIIFKAELIFFLSGMRGKPRSLGRGCRALSICLPA